MNVTVGIAEMKVAADSDDVLVTYSLGSCVGLCMSDPEAGVAGMVHCMLPLSRIDPAKAAANPFMFTDTGVQGLIQELLTRGAQKRRLVAKVAGGASPLGESLTFKIGQRNYAVLRKVLWKNNILIAAEDVGGAAPRTMYHYVGSGKTTIRSAGREWEL